MTRPVEVNLFELEASEQVFFPQVTSNDQLAHFQDRLEWALSEKELANEYSKMKNRLLQPVTPEDWVKDQNDLDFHNFMKTHFASDKS